MPVTKELYELIHKWEEDARSDPRDKSSFGAVLDEILFHANIRFHDYIQYRDEGEFSFRLKKWLDNVSNDRDKKILFKLLPYIMFIDRPQMLSLHRDAYRRIIIPWVSISRLHASDILSINYENKVYSLLREYQLLSITQSFDNPDFLNANNLTGLPKPIILGEDKNKVSAMLPKYDESLKGLILFEDFVGTGKTARNVVIEVINHINPKWRLLFIPLIILERGLTLLNNERELSGRVTIEPVLVISNNSCIQKDAYRGEPDEFRYVRALVKSTAKKVLERYGDHDDPPDNPFGYKGSGALLVTCHNTPNNSLPLIYHRSPSWFALFRRIHHSKDGLR